MICGHQLWMVMHVVVLFFMKTWYNCMHRFNSQHVPQSGVHRWNNTHHSNLSCKLNNIENLVYIFQFHDFTTYMSTYLIKCRSMLLTQHTQLHTTNCWIIFFLLFLILFLIFFLLFLIFTFTLFLLFLFFLFIFLIFLLLLLLLFLPSLPSFRPSLPSLPFHLLPSLLSFLPSLSFLPFLSPFLSSSVG